MSEGTEGETNPQAENTLDKMARGMTEETGAWRNLPQGDIPQGGIQEGKQGGAQEGDALPLIEGKMKEMGQDITEETGGHGDIHLHTERKMKDMAQKMFKED
jgi:hypothetical protein